MSAPTRGRMKIALCTIGSRGDVQPFMVLGEFLSQQGHEVKVSSAKMYEPLSQNFVIEYVPFEGDYESIMNDSELKKKIGRNPFAIGKSLREQVYPIIESSLETFYELLKWADVVLYHPKTMIDRIGFDMKFKLIKAYVVPLFTPTKEFPNPILTFLPIPSFLNRLTYKFADVLMNLLNGPIRNFKQRHQLAKSATILDTPILYGISPSFFKRPTDYPNDHHFTGFWMKVNKQKELSEEVRKFMSKEEKVLIITFGSMPYQSQIDINEFVKAIVDQYGIKVLIVRGWGLKAVSINESDQVLAIDSAPFELLFPLATYVVHHGGAGTTAIALKAGIPQFICPVLHPFGDQYFWGKQVEKMQVGVKPIPLKKLTIQKLLDAFVHLKDEKLKANATELQGRITQEDGLMLAKQLIEEHYAKYCGQ